MKKITQRFKLFNPRQKISLTLFVVLIIAVGIFITRQIMRADVIGTISNQANLAYTDSQGNAKNVLSNTVQISLYETNYSISGHVELQNYYIVNVTTVPIRVELRKQGGSTTTQTVNLNSSGNYTLTNIPVGNYNLAFKASHWLQKVTPVPPATLPVNQNVTGVNVSLINGDVDGDNEVTSDDLTFMMTAFGTSVGPPPSPKWDARCDLDGEGEVTSDDLTFLMTNFGKIGDN